MMKSTILGLGAALIVVFSSQTVMAEESADMNKSGETEKKFRIVPLVSSNPTTGTGVGVVSSYLYKIDESSSSQWMSGGQYTNTKSWNLFTKNIAYFRDDTIQSFSGFFYSHNKSQFSVDFDGMGIVDYDVYPDLSDDVKFDVDIAFVGQKLFYRVKDNIFIGGHALYVWQQWSNPNEAGELFIAASGIENSARGAVGLDLSYDTRKKTEHFYPRDSEWFTVFGTAFPKAFGSEENYYSGIVDLRLYRPGFNEEDVWANQLYGKYTSQNAPDGGLAALGSHQVLRGFPIGKYKARYLTVFQSEYRYQFVGTKYRAVAFAGVANLSGGSEGSGAGNRDSNNGYYYSGGVGLRYAIQPKTGVDLRVDIVTTSDHESSVYIGLNQAF